MPKATLNIAKLSPVNTIYFFIKGSCDNYIVLSGLDCNLTCSRSKVSNSVFEYDFKNKEQLIGIPTGTTLP